MTQDTASQEHDANEAHHRICASCVQAAAAAMIRRTGHVHAGGWSTLSFHR